MIDVCRHVAIFGLRGIFLTAGLLAVAPRGSLAAEDPVAVPAAEPAAVPAPAVSPPAESTPAEDDAAAAAALAALPGEGDEGGPKLSLYGFLDGGLTRHFVHDSTTGGFFPTKATSFVSGNTNLYLDATLPPNWRALMEIRFSQYPNGIESFGSDGKYRREDTRVYDTSSASGRGTVAWGGVILERSFIQWTPTEKFGLAVGYFLTPYGIWNVDHGTPTLISLILPSFLVQEAIPTHQTGVQFMGAFDFSPVELGYRLYLSNGRTPAQVDTNDQKAVGGRLFLRGLLPWTFQVGTSAYFGEREDLTKELRFVPTFSVDPIVTSRYREWSVGLDASVDWRGFRLRTEGLIRHVQYASDLHELDPMGAPGSRKPNRYEHYVYAILAYRFATHFEPYLYEEVEYVSPEIRRGTVVTQSSAGFNIYFTPAVQFKTQFAMVSFKGNSSENIQSLSSRLILVF